jgi:NAD(P)-dependent dehydrogenase (short-subunit alcohol dehydrogenase family)
MPAGIGQLIGGIESSGGSNMKIEGSVALITGANRGLGKAYVEALRAAGAVKIYAGARQPSDVVDSHAIPIRLDVTSQADVELAAQRCQDVNILINNAGVMLKSPMLAEGSDVSMRREMEVNVFGVLAMIRAFAPILGKNGGGAIANMLSVVSWFTFPSNATYCASKHAALAVTDAARIQLRGQGTHVVAVYAGFIDTEMAADLAGPGAPKTSPRQVADRTLEGIANGVDHVRADARSEEMWKLVRQNPEQVEESMQQAWDNRFESTGGR